MLASISDAAGFSPGNFAQISLIAVPEPATGLILLALGSVFLVQRKKRAIDPKAAFEMWRGHSAPKPRIMLWMVGCGAHG